jgi:hypothetical protein
VSPSASLFQRLASIFFWPFFLLVVLAVALHYILTFSTAVRLYFQHNDPNTNILAFAPLRRLLSRSDPPILLRNERIHAVYATQIMERLIHSIFKVFNLIHLPSRAPFPQSSDLLNFSMQPFSCCREMVSVRAPSNQYNRGVVALDWAVANIKPHK